MKCFKKITAVLLTAIMSAVSVGSMVSASAAEVSENAVYAKRYYFYASSNTYIAKLNANVSYNPNLTKCTINNVGEVGGTFNVNDIEIIDTQNMVYMNYTNSSPSDKSGYLGFVDFVSKSTYPNINDINITSLKNDRGNELAKSNIYISVLDMGDVNSDGIVNTKDVELLNKYLVGSYYLPEIGKLKADIDGDGVIDTYDTILLMRYLEGYYYKY